MYQMVFVVNDKYAQRIIGVYNEFPDARKAAWDYTKANYTGYEISITPVVVDLDNPTNGARGYWLNEQEVVDAVTEEMDVAYDDYTADEADAEPETAQDDEVTEDEDETETEEDEELTDEEVDDLIADAVDELAEKMADLLGDVIRKVTGR